MGESVVPTPEETAVVKSFDETIVTNIGRPIKRKEDQRLLTGAGRFTDDFHNSRSNARALNRRLARVSARTRARRTTDERERIVTFHAGGRRGRGPGD